jgi:hypothetical protein
MRKRVEAGLGRQQIESRKRVPASQPQWNSPGSFAVHDRYVLSPDALTIRVPSGLDATECT